MMILSLSISAIAYAKDGSDDNTGTSTKTNPFRRELRQEIKDIKKDSFASSSIRKEMRDENKNIRNEIMKNRVEIKDMKASTTVFRRDIKDQVKLLKASTTMSKEQFKTMRAEMISQVKELREETKDKVKELRSDIKMSRENRLGNIVSIVENQIITLDSAYIRINDKINNLPATSTISKEKIDSAKSLISQANTNITKSKSLLETLKTNAGTINASSTSAQIVAVRKSAQDIVKLNNESKTLLIRALNEIRQSVAPEKKSPEATTTSSTPETATSTN